MDGSSQREEGYATDLTTDKAISWLEGRDTSKPFFLMCQHKAPHRTFAPALRHLGTFDDVEIPEPDNLFDKYENRSVTLADNEMEIDRHFDWAYDAKVRKDERDGVELPEPDRYGTPEYNRMTPEQKSAWDAHFGPKNKTFLKDVESGTLSHKDIVRWKYRRYMRNYLSTVRGVDENIGRMLDYLDEHGLTENTVVIYSSDQGFFLGEHGWYDKRWMFEESFRMPFLIRWPGVVIPQSRPKELIQNIDYAPTFLDIAGVEVPGEVQGRSLMPLLRDQDGPWRNSLYYAYYELGEHAVPQHFGVRTQSHKLIYFPKTSEWNLFDLKRDPNEMRSVHAEPEYQEIREQLEAEFMRLRRQYEAPPFPS
jgi:N-acetylglucosamine-6-sulfatase